jgi:hypothetical protein
MRGENVDAHDNPSLPLTIGPEHGGSRRLTAFASTTIEAIAEALSGLLTIYRGEPGESNEETTAALAFRAEGADLAALVRGLGEAMLEDVDHEAYDVRAVQFNGFVRTEDGFAGWGYVLASEGGLERPSLTFTGVDVEASLHRTTVTMSVRRRD